MPTNRVRLDEAGNELADILCGCVEVCYLDGFFRLMAFTTKPAKPVVLPKKYLQITEARADCELLNQEEHPVSRPVEMTLCSSL